MDNKKRKNSIFADSCLWSLSNTIFFFVLGVIHTFLLSIISLLLNWRSDWPIVLLLVFSHHIFIGFIFLLFFYLRRRVLELADISHSKFLEVSGLPFFSLLPFPFNYFCIKGLSVLSYRKFLVIIHRYFYNIDQFTYWLFTNDLLSFIMKAFYIAMGQSFSCSIAL